VLDLEVVARALGFLAVMGISVVTFSNEPALVDCHESRIALAADGSWSFEPLQPATATA
jgi:hypothetical protein